MNRFWWTGIAALFVMTPVWGDDNATRENLRTITVSGTAEIKVKPDKVIVRLGVITFSNNLHDARRDAEERLNRVLALLSKFEIDEKDQQTDYLSITPQYRREDYTERMDKFLGYQVSTALIVTVRQLKKIDAFIAEAVNAGATHVHSVSFETSELRKHRDEARKLAIRAAREKAVLLTGELGQEIGLARTISEDVESYWGQGGGLFGGGGGGGGVADDDDEDQKRTIAAGEISVKSTVTIVFDLK